MRGRTRASRCPPDFGLPPSIQKMSSNDTGRARPRRRWCLRVVDEQHAAQAADLLTSVRKPRKAARPCCAAPPLDAERQHRDRLRRRRSARCAAPRIEPMSCRLANRVRARRRRPRPWSRPRGLTRPPAALHVTLTTRPPACSRRSAIGRAETVDVADDRRARPAHRRDQPLLHRGVVFDGAVAVEIILGDVEQEPTLGAARASSNR